MMHVSPFLKVRISRSHLTSSEHRGCSKPHQVSWVLLAVLFVIEQNKGIKITCFVAREKGAVI